jgi:hypothetical protein
MTQAIPWGARARAAMPGGAASAAAAVAIAADSAAVAAAAAGAGPAKSGSCSPQADNIAEHVLSDEQIGQMLNGAIVAPLESTSDIFNSGLTSVYDDTNLTDVYDNNGLVADGSSTLAAPTPAEQADINQMVDEYCNTHPNNTNQGADATTQSDDALRNQQITDELKDEIDKLLHEPLNLSNSGQSAPTQNPSGQISESTSINSKGVSETDTLSTTMNIGPLKLSLSESSNQNGQTTPPTDTTSLGVTAQTTLRHGPDGNLTAGAGVSIKGSDTTGSGSLQGQVNTTLGTFTGGVNGSYDGTSQKLTLTGSVQDQIPVTPDLSAIAGAKVTETGAKTDWTSTPSVFIGANILLDKNTTVGLQFSVQPGHNSTVTYTVGITHKF